MWAYKSKRGSCRGKSWSWSTDLWTKLKPWVGLCSVHDSRFELCSVLQLWFGLSAEPRDRFCSVHEPRVGIVSPWTLPAGPHGSTRLFTGMWKISLATKFLYFFWPETDNYTVHILSFERTGHDNNIRTIMVFIKKKNAYEYANFYMPIYFEISQKKNWRLSFKYSFNTDFIKIDKNILSWQIIFSIACKTGNYASDNFSQNWIKFIYKRLLCYY